MTVVLAEIAVIIGRAAAAREVLEQLIDVVPDDHWERREPGSRWSAREHLQHLATMDAPTAELFEQAATRPTVAPLGARDAAELVLGREALLASVAELSIEALRERMEAERAHTYEVLTTLEPPALDAAVLLPGIVDAWGRVQQVSVRQYAAAWAAHDLEHAEAIRRAVTHQPSPGDLALAARRRRG